MDPATLISRCRTEAGLSQRELAAQAGTSAAAICLYESGRRQPRVDTLTRIIAATGATLSLAVLARPAISIHTNSRALAELLDLTDDLPRRFPRDGTAPVFSRLTAR